MGKDIHYKNNFLTSVICRVDLEGVITDETIKGVLSNNEIMGLFPLIQKDIINYDRNFAINADEESLSTTKDTYVIHARSDRSGKNKLFISKKHFLIDYGSYETFETTMSHFMKIVSTVLESSPDSRIRRFGLRYINVFNADESRIQKNYFSSTINGLVNIDNISGMEISRAIGSIEYVSEDIRLMMKYGDFNRNYPGVLEKHDFVLDYDAYIEGSYQFSEVFPQRLEKAHDMIQTAFEESITDKLRNAMKG